MNEEPKICTHIKKIDQSKFCNALNNFEKSNCSFKHEKGINSDSWQSLWICLKKKCYKKGCGRSSHSQCMIKHHEKDNKHCVVVRPSDEMIWYFYFFTFRCYECDDSLVQQLELLKLNPNYTPGKIQKDLEKVIKAIKEKLYKFKSRLNLQTEENLEKKINPKVVEQRKKFELAEEKGKKELITPSSVFGIGNLGNTCFFNATMQALNATRSLVNYYLNSAQNFKKNDEILKSKFFFIKKSTKI